MSGYLEDHFTTRAHNHKESWGFWKYSKDSSERRVFGFFLLFLVCFFYFALNKYENAMHSLVWQVWLSPKEFPPVIPTRRGSVSVDKPRQKQVTSILFILNEASGVQGSCIRTAKAAVMLQQLPKRLIERGKTLNSSDLEGCSSLYLFSGGDHNKGVTNNKTILQLL